MSETYRIVIADDEAIICMDLKEILEETDIDLENASKIINAPTPTANNDVATKQYVDNAITNSAGIVVRFVLIFASTSYYSNLNSFNVPNLFSDPTVDYHKPLYVSFQRSNVSRQNLGRYTGTIIYN